jgi:hypothetical protein
MKDLPPAPVSDAVVISALQDSVVELRPLIETLFANDQRAAGILLAQLKLIFNRLQQGLPSRRSDYLSLLDAASRVPGEAE